MSNVKCTYCGSVYTDDKGEIVMAEGKQKKYFCHSCKREFFIPEGDPQLKGEKIATFYGDSNPGNLPSFDHIYVELYKTTTGEFYTYSKYYGDLKLQNHTPRISLKTINTTKVNYVIEINTFTSHNDKNGMLASVYRIKFNDEYTAEALKNDAMRAAYDSKKGLFDISDNNNYKMLKDMSEWLRSMVGVPVQQAPLQKSARLFGGLFGKKKG